MRGRQAQDRQRHGHSSPWGDIRSPLRSGSPSSSDSHGHCAYPAWSPGRGRPRRAAFAPESVTPAVKQRITAAGPLLGDPSALSVLLTCSTPVGDHVLALVCDERCPYSRKVRQRLQHQPSMRPTLGLGGRRGRARGWHRTRRVRSWFRRGTGEPRGLPPVADLRRRSHSCCQFGEPALPQIPDAVGQDQLGPQFEKK